MKRVKLYELRKNCNLTQQELSKLIGIKRSYYGLIENGVRTPSLEIAIKIADILNSNVKELFGDLQQDKNFK